MFGTGNLLELKRFLSGLDYITVKIKENWGDLKDYENTFFEWLQDAEYMGGFYDYLRGDHDALLLCEVNNLVVKLETFFKDGNNYADIDTWELKDDVKGKIRLSYHELADYLGFWRTKIHKYAGTGGKPQQKQKTTLKDRMINDGDGGKLQKLHTVWGKRKGKNAALLILACIEKGWMTKPTFTEVEDEFGDIGNRSGFNKYMHENMFRKEELGGAINSLD